MKFLIDAHLPGRLVAYLVEHGHDALHVSALPNGFETSDAEIAAWADTEARVVISKDADFVNSHRVSGVPARLLAIKTGNISNAELIALFDTLLDDIARAFRGASYVELHQSVLVVNSSKPR